MSPINVEVEVDVDDILSELDSSDIVKWLSHASQETRKRIVKDIGLDLFSETIIKIETLTDQLKYEALLQVWNDITVEDIEKLKK